LQSRDAGHVSPGPGPASPAAVGSAAAGTGEGSTSLDAGSDGAAAPSCVPEGGDDAPDDAFTDSNCDGIDGDADAAIFVSTTGADGASGTMAAPLRTFGEALTLAAARGKSVYACNGVYAENVALATTAVSLFGGYDCEHGWRRIRDHAVIAPPRGVPLTVAHVGSPLVIDRLAFHAADAVEPGSSSIAASVFDSNAVRFVRVELRAGNAADGPSGAPPLSSEWGAPPSAGSGGSVAASSGCRTNDTYDIPSGGPDCFKIARGGEGPSFTCPDGTPIRGGIGGEGGNRQLAFDPMPGSPGLPRAVIDLASGADGAAGTAGVAGSVGFGSVRDGRYVAGASGDSGQWGPPGLAGRGGPGGSSYRKNDQAPLFTYYVGGGGGQGGYPGCGGSGGGGGGAGGASIALISDSSRVSLTWVRISTGRGGRGGAGSDGALGQPGGAGAAGGRGSCEEPDGTLRHCDGLAGGKGGQGGTGGPGGPGAGGPSIGIAYGNSLVTSNVTFDLGRPGRGGVSSAATAPDGLGETTYGLGAAATSAGGGAK
jgi:hypothetical protein